MTAPMTLEQLAQRLDRLADMSPVRSQLLQCLAQEDPDLSKLVQWVEKDPVIAARVLRVANSPFYGLAHEVDSIAHAVSLVGLRSLQSMALAVAVMEQFKPTDPRLQSTHQEHWRHSVAVAVCTQALARRAHIAVDTAFSAGLLHDLGHFVMLSIDPQRHSEVQVRMRQASTANGSRTITQLKLEAEQAVWGFDHCQVGDMLAQRWQLPASLRRCMALHHRSNDPQADRLVWLVLVGHALAHALDLLHSPEDQVPEVQQSVWDGLQLDWSDSNALLAGIEERFAVVCQQLVS